MKKILFALLLIILLIIPAYASNSENLFNEWKNTYFQDEKYVDSVMHSVFNNLSGDSNSIDLTQFSNLKEAYKSIFEDENDVELSQRMTNDFNTLDSDNNGELTFEEFKDIAPIWCYFISKADYEFFKNTDVNNDGLIDGNEFGSIGYLFAEDSFWEGYSIEEICVVEFESANGNNDEYLNFTEFRSCLGGA